MAPDILLDLDGTLTDPFPGISRCINHALDRQDLPRPPETDLNAWIGPPLLKSFSEYFEQLGRGDPERALTDYRRRFGETGLFENTVYDGIPDVMGTLAGKGHRLYLATSKPAVYARRIVAYFGLDEWLSAAYGSELDGRRTDKVELLQHIVDRECLDPACCAMVGDRRYDMEAARYHGMEAVGALWGYGSEIELLEAGAERLVAHPSELVRA